MNKQLHREGFDPTRLALDETLFHTANGYLGVRACLEEGVPPGVKSIRGTYLNGFYNLKPIAYGERLYGFPTEQEAMVAVADVQTVQLFLGGERFTPFEGTVHTFRRTLDMGRGLSLRSVGWTSASGHTIEVRVERMASFTQPSLFLLRYSVASRDYDGPVTFESLLDGDVHSYADPDDPRVAQEAVRHLRVRPGSPCSRDGVRVLVCDTLSSGLSMAAAVTHRLNGARTDALHTVLRPGETVVLEKWCAFADSRRTEDPADTAFRILTEALAHPMAYHFEAQQAYLQCFWDTSRVEIDGDPAMQEAVDFSLYQLLQSAGRDSLSNVCAKGLSGEGYEGHYFWDTEIYIFPFFLLTDHARAKQLLRYRYGILDAARAHARTLGHRRGALYPWRTIAGRECSAYYPSGSAQYHINADVAHAVIQYWRLTHDLDFLAEMGAEMLVETARLWMDVGHMAAGAFRICHVTGPDEYTCLVNNNYYTNLGARENLSMAVEAMETLAAADMAQPVQDRLGVTAEELAAFQAAAEAMCLPYDETLGIFLQDDAFLQRPVLHLSEIPPADFPLLLTRHPLFLYRHQVLKQADVVLAHLLHEEGIDPEDMRRSYAYYEPLTTHDSSLSPCAYGIMAARLGMPDKAMAYFLQTLRMDLDDTHGNTADGIHTANLGGVYLGVVMGMAGLRVFAEGVSLRPWLPPDIEGYRFSFLVEGARVRCRVSAAGCELTLLEGQQATVTVHEQPVHLTPGVPVRIP